MLRVIVADDERPARQMVAGLVTAMHGLQLVADTDCGETLAMLIAREHPDLLLLDPDLPQLSIVPLPSTPPQRPLIVWLRADDEPVPEVGGAAFVLHKPVLPAEFAQIVAAVTRQLQPLDGRTSANARGATTSAATHDAPAAATRSSTPSRAPAGASQTTRIKKSDVSPAATPAATAGARGGRELLGLAAAFFVAMYLFAVRAPTPTDTESILRGVASSVAAAEYQPLSFSILSGFDYETGSPGAQIPRAVRELGGRKVALRGFMLPLDVNDEGVRTFLLNASYDMCAFGAPSGAPNQWVEVRMAGARRAPYVHTPIVVLGKLDVGEVRNQGRVVSLYRLVADAAEVPR